MAAKAYRFGDWKVEPLLNRLSNGERAIELEPTTMNVLTFMLEHPGETLSIDQFLSTVWESRIVEPNSVHRSIAMIRRALGDDARNPQYVANVRKRGYRTLATVVPLNETLETEDTALERAKLTASAREPSNATLANEERRRSTVDKRVVASVIVAILVTAGVAGWWIAASERHSPANADAISAIIEKSVAILPFTDLSPDGDQQYFGDGIAEELLNRLTRLEGLRVASRASSFAYGDSGGDILSIAEALNVATVLHGSVRKSGDQIRVTAKLTDARSGFHLWSHTFSGELTGIFAIQDEIAEAVTGALGVSLGVGDVNAFTGAGTTDIEAYEAYLRATQLYLPRQPDERIRLLERAVELDPEYAAAWASLGLTIGASMWISPVEQAPEIMDRAMPAVHRAVELGPNSSFAYNMLATVNYATMDWIRSEQYFAKAFQMSPDGETFANYANMMMRSGRSQRAIRYQELAAMAERNPVGNSINFNAALALGDTDSAGRRPTNFGGISRAISDILWALNSTDPGKLRAALQRVSPSDGGFYILAKTILPKFESQPEVLSSIRSVYRNSEALWPAKHHDTALLAAFFGDPEFALQAISQEARLTTIRYGALWYPVMSEVRKLPGFERLMTDVNLVAYWRSYGWPDHCRPKGSEDFDCF